jgi:integrase
LPKYRDKVTGEVRTSNTWWIQYNHRGRTCRESSHTANRPMAANLLRQRLSEISRGRFVGPEAERTTFKDLAQMLVDDYTVNARKSAKRAGQSMAHLIEHFGTERAVDITEDRVTKYIRKRQETGATNATINRELAALKRAFRLGEIANKVTRIPYVRMLKESAPRKGFFEAEDLEVLLAHLPDPVKAVVQVAYITGWRVRSEILTRKWEHVDFATGWMRLDPGEAKNEEGRQFPLVADLERVLRQREELAKAFEKAHGKKPEHVFFWPNGSPIRYFRRSWVAACEKAGFARWTATTRGGS